ncbi:MAG: HAMP domain-containing histidine kinase [Clostridiales bacterium]|nr:HAMP domain-containing histidine kinase [Clostridiales bacterium]
MTIIYFAATFMICALYAYLCSLELIYAEAHIIFILLIMTVCAAYFIHERRRRVKLIERIGDILDGKMNETEDSEISPIERRAMLMQRNSEIREAKLQTACDRITSLVSDIAHQTKTPLTTILMYTETLPKSNGSTAIASQTARLKFLIEALTKLSKCECGLIAGSLVPKMNSISELAAQAVSDIIPSAETKQISLDIDIPDNLYAYFDLKWTSEALFNLLDNAVKYSPEQSSIKLHAEPLETYIRVDIIDRGSGIPEEELCKIWERFYRAKNVSEVNGIGVGLYLTREIMHAQSGRVKVESELDVGSKFSIFLARTK